MWSIARRINGNNILAELFGKGILGTREGIVALGKAIDHKGEQWVSVDLESIRSVIGENPRSLERLDAVLNNPAELPGGATSFEVLLRVLSEVLPAGSGKALLHVEGASVDDAVEIDLRTALAMLERRNCLDGPRIAR